MVAGRQRTYYPAFRDKVHDLRRYLDRYKRDMISACQIDGEHLEQLEALSLSCLEQLVGLRTHALRVILSSVYPKSLVRAREVDNTGA